MSSKLSDKSNSILQYSTDIVDEVSDFMGSVHNLLEKLKSQEKNKYTDRQAYEILYISYKIEEFNHILNNYKETLDSANSEIEVKNSMIASIDIMLRKLEIINKNVGMLKALLSDITVSYYEDNKDILDEYISKYSVLNSENKISINKITTEEKVVEKVKIGNITMSQALYSSCLFAVSAFFMMLIRLLIPYIFPLIDYIFMASGNPTTLFDEAYNPGFTALIIDRMGILVLILWVLYVLKLFFTLIYVYVPISRKFIPGILVRSTVKTALNLYGKSIEKSVVMRNSNLVEQSEKVLNKLFSYCGNKCFQDSAKIIKQLDYTSLKCKELNILVQIELLGEYVNRLEKNKSFFDKIDTSFVVTKGMDIYKSLCLL